jgi:hypothetical protein
MPYTKTFKQLMKSTEKTYLGDKVKKPYQKLYGKTYDKKETKQVAFAIAKSRNIKIDYGKKK